MAHDRQVNDGQEETPAAEQVSKTESRPDPNCEKCGGCGFKPTRKVINGVPYDGSARCDCWQMVKVA